MLKRYRVSFVAGLLSGGVVLGACTAQQRQIARDVLDLVDAVCKDSDTVDQCLPKMQRARAAQLEGGAGGIGGGDAGP